MSMSVIGAGFGRTGTLSLKGALEVLGFGPCHHMVEVFAHPEQAPVWLAAARGEPVDWQALLTGYGASVDWPSCHFWRELALRFPAAKVVLTARDPEKWFASFSETIVKAIAAPRPSGVGDPLVAAVGEMAGYIVGEATFGGNLDKAHVLKVYRDHIETVKRTIPPERLLVYEVGEGWGPLCKFLGVPVPAAPFPRTNSREEFVARLPAQARGA